ncbi:MAG: DUF1015 domain-containing protein [Cyanobacteria bacterium SIG30]|nr:DUF1015 domain-containing protein [Cyanobacteria bacterium SIG30]
MVEIKPLNVIVYNQDKVNIEDVVAPPYDVIDSNYQNELYERSDYNIVRLILAKGENRYEDAKNDFNKWLEEKVLTQLDKPCILYIVQKYTTEKGKKVERKGFIARNKIEKFGEGKIFPHEFTMGGPKADRLKLVSACKAFFSQIFMVYSDSTMLMENDIGKKLSETKPFIDVKDDKDVQNLVWVIDDENDIKRIQDMMNDKTLLIADGHHRYETSMNYSNEHPENEEAKYVMSYFTNLDDENLIVYPTHRIITRQIEPYVLLESVKKHYDIEEFIFDSYTKEKVKEDFLAKIEEENQKQITMGLYMKNVNKFYVLKLKPEAQNLVEAPEVLKKLDLTVLHELIITKELGYTKEEQMAQDGIKYIKQEAEAFDMIDLGKAEASFIMAYPKMQDIRDISSAGYKMPQKSTYFYPKLLSGLAINPLWK